MQGTDVGAFFRIQPGFYTQSDIGISSFDVPISLGRIFVVREKKFYIFGGAYASFLRGGWPVLPLGWRHLDRVRQSPSARPSPGSKTNLLRYQKD